MKKTNVKKKAPPAPKNAVFYPLRTDPVDSERFDAAISDWNVLREREIAEGKPQIGMLAEKSLHSIIKRYLVADEAAYEVRVPSRSGELDRRYVADICVDGKIYEIQTGSFYPLIPKIAYYLSETDLDVTVVHPIPYVRHKVWIDPETGEIASRTRSPKKGRAEDALREIFWLREMLPDPRLHVRLLFLEEDEYRYLDGWSYDKKRGSNRCERVPAALFGTVDLHSPEDYRGFLPETLPSEFTAAELGLALRLKGRAVYSALHVFLAIGLASEVGKRGRSALYRREDRAEEATERFDLADVEAEDLTE